MKDIYDIIWSEESQTWQVMHRNISDCTAVLMPGAKTLKKLEEVENETSHRIRYTYSNSYAIASKLCRGFSETVPKFAWKNFSWVENQ